ncbi:hypothetical protein [Gracilimonas sediminicola]|uniref:Uncharacterized protein n=1 Tax=Gracilimonas sediminicola TaxID=2952158 RepID=A0A9X2L5G0_9BACT|nr:hypothetical protein [Gracilimonas sediminicola]MCP9291948.1 hypothetical protein [Gracilimonas sediminicola]
MNLSKAFTLIITAIIGTLPAAAQTYTIPFASKENTLQLEVVNSGQENGQGLLVQAVEIPDWISLSADELHLDNISSGDSQRGANRKSGIHGSGKNEHYHVYFY